MNIPAQRICRLAHVHSEDTLVEIGELSESTLGQIDMLGALGAARTGVDDAHKDTLLRGIAHYGPMS